MTLWAYLTIGTLGAVVLLAASIVWQTIEVRRYTAELARSREQLGEDRDRAIESIDRLIEKMKEADRARAAVGANPIPRWSDRP